MFAEITERTQAIAIEKPWAETWSGGHPASCHKPQVLSMSLLVGKLGPPDNMWERLGHMLILNVCYHPVPTGHSKWQSLSPQIEKGGIAFSFMKEDTKSQIY